MLGLTWDIVEREPGQSSSVTASKEKVLENLGYHTEAFTLDQYGHVSERLEEELAKRMDLYIKNLNKA